MNHPFNQSFRPFSAVPSSGLFRDYIQVYQNSFQISIEHQQSQVALAAKTNLNILLREENKKLKEALEAEQKQRVEEQLMFSKLVGMSASQEKYSNERMTEMEKTIESLTMANVENSNKLTSAYKKIERLEKAKDEHLKARVRHFRERTKILLRGLGEDDRDTQRNDEPLEVKLRRSREMCERRGYPIRFNNHPELPDETDIEFDNNDAKKSC